MQNIQNTWLKSRQKSSKVSKNPYSLLIMEGQHTPCNDVAQFLWHFCTNFAPTSVIFFWILCIYLYSTFLLLIYHCVLTFEIIYILNCTVLYHLCCNSKSFSCGSISILFCSVLFTSIFFYPQLMAKLSGWIRLLTKAPF